MFKDKIKSLIVKKSEGNNKKTIENLVVFLVLLIVTIVAINIIWEKEEEKPKKQIESEYKVLAESIEEGNIKETNAYNLEQELEDILSKIDGVGKVKVLVTYSESNQIIAMYNENKNISVTEEQDSSGGIRTIESTDSNKEIILDGSNNPVTEKIIMPKIEGAIIIAEGGEDAIIKSNIIQAVSAVTGLASHKVQVFKMSK